MTEIPTPTEDKLHILLRDAILPFIPDSPRLRYFLALAKLRAWKKRTRGVPKFHDRNQLYDFVYQCIKSPIDYLEFGVWKGASLKYWLDLIQDQSCRFFGFDTFTGLPEKFECLAMTLDKYTFNMNGELPNIHDPRVCFIKGLFQATLSDFLKNFKPQSQLILHLDADIYSAGLFVLTQFDSFIKSGTIIIFDDFLSVTHDFRALEDYCSAYLRSYTVLGMTGGLHQVAIRF